MKSLSKLKISSLKNETGLSKERMKAIRGGAAGYCFFYCHSSGSEYTLSYEAGCNTAEKPCKSELFSCFCKE